MTINNKSSNSGNNTASNRDAGSRNESAGAGYGIAVDLGSTNIACKLLDLGTGKEIASKGAVNAQRRYGADVVTRITKSMDDSSLLSGVVRGQLREMFTGLAENSGIKPGSVTRIVISGNTTMCYLLLGLPCRSLAVAPFTPEFTMHASYPYKEALGSDEFSCDVIIFPWISAYVGGDIVSGLLTLAGEEDFLLVDMGTNGEIARKLGGELFCTGTAAGPAFERASLPGSKLIDFIAGALEDGRIDPSGRVTNREDTLFAGRSPKTSQKFIRDIQLAKSAIRSGVDIMIEETGGNPPEHIYLAGGFGQHIIPANALRIGLLPESIGGRVSFAGNTSLIGAVKLCLEPELLEEARVISESATTINLATHSKFSTYFMDNIPFPK